jgi:Holliday junction resolvase RusA-like endonuclease
VPEQKYTRAVRLITKWCFLITGQHKNGEYKTTKPDTDNLQKLLKDCMTDLGYWTDDALVASEITEKFWAEMPGIYIAIESLGGDG